ncbi:MAG: RHS repeat domain-containing protein, partial [Rhodanobacteraceae bacterium]
MTIAVLRRAAARLFLTADATSALCVPQVTVGCKHPSASCAHRSSRLGRWRVLLVLPLIAACISTARADITPENEYKDLIRVSTSVAPLGEHPFGAQIGLYQGSLSFLQTDVSLPGNGLTLNLARSFHIVGRDAVLARDEPLAFGDWALAIPRIVTLTANQQNVDGWLVGDGESTQRCSQFDTPPTVAHPAGDSGRADWIPATWWHGYQLIVPGHGSQDLLANVDSATKSTYPAVTKSHWRISCLSSTANGMPGEGFLAHSPDGTRYWFDELSYRAATTLSRALGSGPLSADNNSDSTNSPDASSIDFLHRRQGIMRVTRVEDRFGNWLQYHYDAQGRLTSITAKDGRSLDIAYVTGTKRVDTVTVQPSVGAVRVWSYAYAVGANPAQARLTAVTLPDGSAWQLDLAAFDINATLAGGTVGSCKEVGVPGAAGTTWTGTLTHPSGLQGQFKVKVLKHGRSNVLRECRNVSNGSEDSSGSYAVFPKAWYSFTLVERQLSGAGLPTRTWSYDYSNPNASWTDEVSRFERRRSTVWTRVTRPDNSKVKSTFSNLYGYTESQLLSVVTRDATSRVRRTLYTWASPTGQPWPTWVGDNLQERINAAQTEQRSPMEKRRILENGNTWTWQALTFNSYAQVTKTSRDNNADSQPALIETDSYLNDTTNWVLGLPLDHVNVNTGETVRHNVYNTGNDTLSQRWSFGRKIMDYSWYGNGLLYAFTDAKNHTTTLTNYKRGIPRTIQYADASQKTLVVDDLAQIKSVTDEENHTTSYHYDSMGRVTYVGYPYDTGGWNPRNITFTHVFGNERGIMGSHWKRTVSEGDMRTVTYYDALWQPILTDTWDVADASSHISTRSDYDYAGRATFASYPKAGAFSLGSLTQGKHSDYDALGRATAQRQDSELG